MIERWQKDSGGIGSSVEDCSATQLYEGYGIADFTPRRVKLRRRGHADRPEIESCCRGDGRGTVAFSEDAALGRKISHQIAAAGQGKTQFYKEIFW